MITLSLGFTFVESIATAVIETMGLIIDIPYAQGTRHLDEEEQKAKVDELHEFLVHGNHIDVHVSKIKMIYCKRFLVLNYTIDHFHYF